MIPPTARSDYTVQSILNPLNDSALVTIFPISFVCVFIIISSQMFLEIQAGK